MENKENRHESMLSYIIPVYNAEAYIARCVRSLMEQNYSKIEYIFVDDNSQDKSIDLLRQTVDDYPNRKPMVKILTHNKRKGSATSRNDGLDVATGDFIMFADSDDYVDLDYVTSMVNKAEKENSDILYCDYYESYRDGDVLVQQDYGTDPSICICSMLSRAMHGSTCNKIFRRTFLLHAKQRFVDGADLFEDVGWNVRLMAYNPRISYIPRAFYHYVKYNSGSIIASMTEKEYSRMRCIQRIRNVDVTCRCLVNKGVMQGDVCRAAHIWMLMAKNDLIEANNYSLKKWMVTFPEADAVIWHCRQITLNLKLLLTWLHFHNVCLYHLQKCLTGRKG